MAWLLLEDGTKYPGELFGAEREALGEVVFNTSMVGYQELLTDPSYCGQMVVMTYPLIGNYGANSADMESGAIQPKALIVHETCEEPCNWMSEMTLGEFLKRNNVAALTGVDTRAITRKIREEGVVRGMVVCGEPTQADLEKIRGFKLQRPVDQVTCKERYELPGDGLHIAAMDYGAKRSMLGYLNRKGCRVTVFPAGTSAEEVLSTNPDGIFLSNGPGDPKDNPEIIENVKKLIGTKPIFGICLGFQLMALASGAQTQKMKYGHRGANHPVKSLRENRCYITAQNHGYAVMAEGMPENVEITHVNWNDQTVEGIRIKGAQAFGVQYHPEANPGPEESSPLFDEFLNMVQKAKEE